VSLNESSVALVLLAGLIVVAWRGTHPGSSDLAMRLPQRSVAGVSSA